ncbi:MAG: polymerase [Ramlibacter sp.]|jgi:uracil-DNA glycosylase family 4|nr:polymerase [Ramlibacter sp.]
MSLELDERQHAMLAEMGVRLFQPHSHPGRIDGTPPEPARQAPPKPALTAGGDVRRPQVVVPVVAQAARAPVQTAEGATSGVELMQWDALAQAVAQCRGCSLCNGRRNTVFGVGDRQADWLIVGEAPGENEDLQGEPFVGQAGLLLDNMLKALGLDRRQKVYIANVLKCRPPGNRNPEPQEVAQCEPFLRRQVELLQPRIILAMGRFAVQALLQSNEPIGKLRGKVHRYNEIPLVVTYHPAYLLRNLPDKAKAWADLCLALEVLQQSGG